MDYIKRLESLVKEIEACHDILDRHGFPREDELSDLKYSLQGRIRLAVEFGTHRDQRLKELEEQLENIMEQLSPTVAG